MIWEVDEDLTGASAGTRCAMFQRNTVIPLAWSRQLFNVVMFLIFDLTRTVSVERRWSCCMRATGGTRWKIG